VFGIGIGVAEEPGADEADALAVGDAVPVADGTLLGDGDAFGALVAGGVQPVSRKSSAAMSSDRGIWIMYQCARRSVSMRQRFGPQGVQLR
jgi:hypothetical protein